MKRDVPLELKSRRRLYRGGTHNPRRPGRPLSVYQGRPNSSEKIVKHVVQWSSFLYRNDPSATFVVFFSALTSANSKYSVPFCFRSIHYLSHCRVDTLFWIQDNKSSRSGKHVLKDNVTSAKATCVTTHVGHCYFPLARLSLSLDAGYGEEVIRIMIYVEHPHHLASTWRVIFLTGTYKIFMASFGAILLCARKVSVHGQVRMAVASFTIVTITAFACTSAIMDTVLMGFSGPKFFTHLTSYWCSMAYSRYARWPGNQMWGQSYLHHIHLIGCLPAHDDFILSNY